MDWVKHRGMTMHPHVVILGGGFGGLEAARRLKSAPVRISLVDRHNHHLFQPLLYQVATAALSPGDIASPIRWILRHHRNAQVLLAGARSIEVEERKVLLDRGELNYDYLIVATGATHSTCHLLGAYHNPHLPDFGLANRDSDFEIAHEKRLLRQRPPLG